MAKLTDGDRQELLALNHGASANIAAYKNRPWQILGVVSAVWAVALLQAPQESFRVEIWATATLIVTGAALVMLTVFQLKLMQERKVLTAIYSHFGQPFHYAHRFKGLTSKNDVGDWYVVVIAAVYLIVGWILIVKTAGIEWSWIWKWGFIAVVIVLALVIFAGRRILGSIKR